MILYLRSKRRHLREGYQEFSDSFIGDGTSLTSSTSYSYSYYTYEYYYTYSGDSYEYDQFVLSEDSEMSYSDFEGTYISLES